MQFIAEQSLIKYPLFFLNIFLMLEIFFHYKILKAQPTIPVAKSNEKNIDDSFTLQAYYPFVSEMNGGDVLKKIVKYPQIKHVLEKAAIAQKELTFQDVDKELLKKSAFDIAKTFKGTYVTTFDVLVAYLFLIEKDTKLLFAKQLKSEDFYNIVYWAKLEYSQEETPKKLRIHTYGSGIGDWLVTGWTPETQKYTSDFTKKAIKEEPILHGTEGAFKQLLEGIIKVDMSNALIIGDIGAGKENLVRALSYHCYAGNLGNYLNYKRVYELHVGPFLAGASDRADLEVRLQNIIAEISHSGNVLLYIPEFQNILGASSYNLDLSGALLPVLKDGSLPIIATMTMGSYKTFMQKNPLKEVFSVIELQEPDESTAIQMAMGDAEQIEQKYKVIISYRAVCSAVELSAKYNQDQSLPGSAISLLESVANAVAQNKTRQHYDTTRRKMVVEEDIVKKVEESSHVSIAMPTGAEIDLLLHLEDKLHERVIAQDEGIRAIAEAMRRVRSGISTSERPMSFLFLGPTGVGKTETAKALADFYFGGEKHIIRLDMSEYADEDGVKRLLGAPPGQGNDPGELTDKIHDNPASLLLLDEFEKANPKIHNLFLQVLDDGRLTDNKGVTVSFRNCIIIATSNAGSEFIREEVEKKIPIDKVFQQRLLAELQTKAIFKPELLNRFDDIVTFKPLGEIDIQQVVTLLLQSITTSLAKQDITVTFDDAVIEKISSEGFDRDFGARPLRRYIQDNIEDMLAQKKLTKEIVRGKKASFSIDGTGALSLTVA
jgi:ATP-dependent Clp protease ATP-binding subunit ClpC